MSRATPELAPPSIQTSTPHQQEDFWPLTYDSACSGPTYTADLQWNRDLSVPGSRRDSTEDPPCMVLCPMRTSLTSGISAHIVGLLDLNYLWQENLANN
ncbi:hypothetical protein AVEN_125871-1 [Araneus ventricosus]|uniref:Uncharacterized protein n=1 Tax=Araneus ventricosus TaxID=182803 RepID=A0A4Y2F2X6_ARAVE|nr:hypothetical protein AVEN_125871-1 [Araneus ventricosus]